MIILDLIHIFIADLKLNNKYTEFVQCVNDYQSHNDSIIHLYEFITTMLSLNYSLIMLLNYRNINSFIYELIIYQNPHIIDKKHLQHQIDKLSFILKNDILYQNLSISRKKKGVCQ
jgi:hypothetical protein